MPAGSATPRLPGSSGCFASLSLNCPAWKPQATQPACHRVAVRVKSTQTPHSIWHKVTHLGVDFARIVTTETHLHDSPGKGRLLVPELTGPFAVGSTEGGRGKEEGDRSSAEQRASQPLCNWYLNVLRYAIPYVFQSFMTY